MRPTKHHIREIFLLQLAIVCLVVVLCVLGVQAAYGDAAMPWLSATAIVIALGAIISVSWMGHRAAQRVVGCDVGVTRIGLFCTEKPGAHIDLGTDGTGHDAPDADLLAAEFGRHHPGEAFDRRLGGRIR